MLFIVLVTQLVLFIVTYRVNMSNKLVGTLYVAFNMWWSILLIVSYFAPYGRYKISFNTYILIWLFLSVFNIFFSLSCSKKNKYDNTLNYKNFQSKNEELSRQYVQYLLNNKKLTIILYAITIILLYYTIRYGSIMTKENILNARNYRFYVGGLFKSTYELLFYNFIVSAFRYYFAFVVAFSIIFGMVKNLQFMLCLIDLFLYSYIGSSRLPLGLLIISILIMWIIRNSYHSKQTDTNNVKRFFTSLLT